MHVSISIETMVKARHSFPPNRFASRETSAMLGILAEGASFVLDTVYPLRTLRQCMRVYKLRSMYER